MSSWSNCYDVQRCEIYFSKHCVCSLQNEFIFEAKQSQVNFIACGQNHVRHSWCTIEEAQRYEDTAVSACYKICWTLRDNQDREVRQKCFTPSSSEAISLCVTVKVTIERASGDYKVKINGKKYERCTKEFIWCSSNVTWFYYVTGRENILLFRVLRPDPTVQWSSLVKPNFKHNDQLQF